MKAVSFSYNGESNVLQNISLQIKSGEKVCIMGKDSSGKSTLLRLMAGAYPDFEGVILLNDLPLGNYELTSIRSQTGVLMNVQDIFHGTIRENIVLGNEDVTMESIVECAGKVGLNDFIDTLKNGYDTMLDPIGKRLPGNVIHKLLLVRALAGKPRLLLLEEPWLNRETGHRSQIIKLLNELKDITVIVVSNDEEFAASCDKVFTMTDGSIISSVTASKN